MHSIFGGPGEIRFEVKLMIGRFTKDGRIVPVSVTDGLVPQQPFSPWLAGGKSVRSKAA